MIKKNFIQRVRTVIIKIYTVTLKSFFFFIFLLSNPEKLGDRTKGIFLYVKDPYSSDENEKI